MSTRSTPPVYGRHCRDGVADAAAHS